MGKEEVASELVLDGWIRFGQAEVEEERHKQGVEMRNVRNV